MSLTDHLASGNTTLAYCWVIERLDGVTIGVTDHNEDVTVDGVLCSATEGIMTTKFEQALGLVADDLEIEGVVTDDEIKAQDIRAGKFDDATVKLYLVNWQDTSEFLHLASGKFGQIIEKDGDVFNVEFLSRSYDLAQPNGRTYQRTCDTKLGSTACGIDLNLAIYRAETTIQDASGTNITAVDLSAYENDWFTLGKVILNDEEIGIRSHNNNVLSLWREPSVPLASGDPLVVIAGCRQDADTCKEKFNNLVNFQGFSFMPGNDRLTDYPVRGQDEYDGGSLFL